MNNVLPAPDLNLRSALSSRARPGHAPALSAALTFWWRAMLKIRHVPEQMFDVTASPIMFLLMFTYLFGGAIAGSTGEYLQYVLPGILVMTVAFITIYTGSGVSNDIRKGVFDRFRSLPIWQPAFLVGALLADTVRYTIASAVIIMLGLVLGFRPEGGAAGVAASVLLLLAFSFSLSWIWIALGLVMRTRESLMAVSMVILFPLTFVSNVFVLPQTMPAWLEAVVNVNPITHLVAAIRGLMSGTVMAGEIGLVLLASVVLVVVFSPLTVYLSLF
ncbi:MAG: ABC transporter permease [Chloroflexi bacterium]|nr:ABC transporter permease [Chloroflexota bacterium]